MKTPVKLMLNGENYIADFNNNNTATHILRMLPIELALERCGGHEYYGELPQKPSILDVPTTSRLKAGDICYFDGWNAFSVLFAAANIEPFQVILLGHINADLESLRNAPELITAQLALDE